MESIIPFLKELQQNNNREWFKAHKTKYERTRKEFEAFIEKIIAGIGTFDTQVAGLTSKASVFRIYRDVRFSKDKRPYKTHYGAFMAENGRKSSKAGYYLHIEPGNCFLGGGLYHPDSEQLKKVRQQIDYDAARLREIVSEKQFKETYGGLTGSQLKTSPRDYPGDHPDIDLLRYKDFLATHFFDDKIINIGDAEYVVNRFKVMKPLNDYLNDALLFEDEEPQVNF
ncbi:MAG TPA: DUF2461 domain-containing protein [Salinivirga sp.]|uniref:DUF2461 domain-containing protein n=1 Tax=Salinivirga sp. TaxID=1970192 RepID=UPI002B49C76B|nr:DUF2461 domain-containing protein [Salinivirga sp.]HKK60750.1 DUF2461 domain-containing protein [Salinivirga sp.]